MATDPRAETVLRAHLAYARALCSRGGGDAREHDGLVLFRAPHPMPFLVNGAARVDASVPPDQALAAAQTYFGGNGFEMLCLSGRDDDLRAAAISAGWNPGDPDLLQHLDRPPHRGPLDRAAVDLRRVDTAAAIADVAAVCADAHEVYRFPADLFPTLFARPETVLSDDTYAIVAYEADTPVATAQAFVHERTAYIGWVGVVRAAAHRGFGWLVTEAVVNEGFRRGADAAVLLASPMGAPLYRKMGFVDVGYLDNAYAPPAAEG
jgi:ribosomal protein S18 acetylase RimI-like enzyme